MCSGWGIRIPKIKKYRPCQVLFVSSLVAPGDYHFLFFGAYPSIPVLRVEVESVHNASAASFAMTRLVLFLLVVVGEVDVL